MVPITFEEIVKKAKDEDIKIISTSLIGRSKNSSYEKFEIGEKRHTVKKCPSGHKPVRENCLVVQQKKRYLFLVSEKKLRRSQLIAKIGTLKYQKLERKRAGIEVIPSMLRRRYKIDHLPVRGEVRSKVWLGFKI